MTATGNSKPNIVLVHGAFADGSSWGRVIPLLVNDGYSVVAVQNPLSSIADDVAKTRRVIDAQPGPTVVVGHSYGGCIISQAAKGRENVKALVYLAAYAPEEGESNGELQAGFPETGTAAAIRPDAAGFAYLDRALFHGLFCPDVDRDTAAVMAAVQKPVHGSTFGDKSGPVAYHDVPTFYQVSLDDKVLHPDMEHFCARRMNATVLELKSSHASLVSHPQEVAAFIKTAAQATDGQ